MDRINFYRLLAIIFTIIQGLWCVTARERMKRGFGDYNFGNSRQSAFDEFNRNQNIALWSAQSAVTSSVGQEYGQQIANLALAAHQFSIPPTNTKKDKQHGNQKSQIHDTQKHVTKTVSLSNQHDHESYPVVVKGSHTNQESYDKEQDGKRVVRIHEVSTSSGKTNPKSSWTPIRSRPYRTGRRTQSYSKKQSCSEEPLKKLNVIN